jgi:ribonuclease HII
LNILYPQESLFLLWYNLGVREFILGVDEAGRGPLAGPVAVGVVRVPVRFNLRRAFPGLNDSKQLSPKKRTELYDEAVARARAGELAFCIRLSGAHYIDTFGITRAVRRGVWGGVRALAPDPAEVKVFLDGLLAAPPEYRQETIIGGDALVPAISLASVMAKVRRDKLMERMAQLYPKYVFDQHKGYGTEAHYRAIRRHGLCDIHRKSFCKL